MKIKNRIRIYPLILMGFVLIFFNSCKKDDNGNDENTVKDIDGNVYYTVTIGTQTWMLENLKVTRYRNGDIIGTTSPSTLDISSPTQLTPKYQWAYGGNESNVATYGRLYTWYAITDSRNVCPTGWHIPTNDEWEILTTYLGGRQFAGNKLRETGSTHWTSTNINATNETGFTALPGGLRDYFGTFLDIGNEGYWWSSTEISGYELEAWCEGIGNFSIVYGYSKDKKFGCSVRCIKD